MECAGDVKDTVAIDPGHLQLVLLNLATNARIAMREQGELNISVSSVAPDSVDLPNMSVEKCVLLEVADTGCGIDSESIQRVFEESFTTERDGVGFGVGLASCKQLIEQVGGTILAKSLPGQGTTFSIYLPTAEEGAGKTSSTVGNFSVGGKERILVVEDDSDVRRVSVQALKAYGYDVSDVDSIQGAREAVEEGGFDLVVVDIRLPDGDGCNLVTEIKDVIPGVSALLVSGYVDDNIRSRVRADGLHVLPKPFTGAALARSVRSTLQASKS